MAKTVEALLLLAKEKIAAAKGLERMGFYRDAVSRAYYGMYHAAQALLLVYGKKAVGHAGTISAFNHHFVKTRKISPDFTKWFSALKESREFADYEGLRKFNKEEAQRATRESERLVHVVEKLIKEKNKVDD